MIDADLLVLHASPLITNGAGNGVKTGASLMDMGEIPDGALAAFGGIVRWVGKSADVGGRVRLLPGAETVDASGRMVAPGFVDPHTHFLYGGSREEEFGMRLAGKTYLEIAAAGGGIRSSVRMTRAASEQELYAQTRHRLDRALLGGVTTAEVKVSYGLDLEHDLKGLRVVGRLREEHPVRIIPTYLGAHEFPDDYRDRREEFVQLVIDGLPEVARQGIARYCDVFCEEGVYTPHQTRRILAAARAAGLGIKVHADEFGPSGGSDVAIELGATSADHLHALPLSHIEPMRKAGVVPVLLPATAFFLRLGHHAPARAMIDGGLPIAVASDCNPGSAMTESMSLVVTLACLQFGLQPEEAFSAATVNAAAALDLAGSVGRLQPGYSADFQLLVAPNVKYLAYHFGGSHASSVYARGKEVVHSGRITARN